jgi:septal ring factor EnvC (AmiA/AmiB activator)
LKKPHCNSLLLFPRVTLAIKCVLLGLVFLSTGLLAQSEKETFEAQKKALLQKIEQNQVILDQTEEKKVSSLGRLRALNNQISSRGKLISAINAEVDYLDEKIKEDQDFINELEKDLEGMKKEYASMMYATQKTSARFSELTFLFAANTFNELFMRYKYMQQYAEARKKQGKQIEMVQESLTLQIEEIQAQRQEKASLLNEELQQNNQLEGLRSQQRSLVRNLEQEESRIRAELAKQIALEKELTARIDAIIEAEARAALVETEDMSAISEAFGDAKGRLRWPVEEGFISSKYGQHKHPTLPRVTENNSGIDIQTSKDAYVKAIFNGKVIGVGSIPGNGIAVVVQHGDYYSSYVKLKAVTVKKGDLIKEGQVLGQVITGPDNVSEMKLRINAKRETVNPEYWIQSKIN